MHLVDKGVTIGQYAHAHESAVQRNIEVSTGEVKVAYSGTTLSSVAIGSCIAVATLDLEGRIGAIAHVMLPGRSPENCLEKTKYAENAIDEMLNLIGNAGTKIKDIEVYLVGAGNVLKKDDDTICQSNVKSVTQILKEKNIPIRASVLGGTERKSVFIDIDNKRISYSEGDGAIKLLWRKSV